MAAFGALLSPIALAPPHQILPKFPPTKTTTAAAGGVDATSKTKLPRATSIFFPTISTKTTTAVGGFAATSKTKLPSRAIKCVSSSSSQNPKPIITSTSKKTLSSNLSKALVVVSGSAAAAGLFMNLHPILTLAGSGNGNGNLSGGGGGGGGGGGDSNGGFWSKVLFPAAYAKEDESQSQEWDSHGLPADMVVQLNKLSGFKRYKVSDIKFFDRGQHTTVGPEDPLFDMAYLPCGIYTKAQLRKELESLATWGMLEKVDLEVKTNADGTINVIIPFIESTWEFCDKFRCINVGLLPQCKSVGMDPNMTDKKEKMEMYRNEEKDERARPCMLPKPVYEEVVQMLMKQEKVSARLLHRILDRVVKWYHDEGYSCAHVLNFGIFSDTKEVVFKVAEGDITQLVIQFQDKLGNVIERNTLLPIVKRELSRQQLWQGHVYKLESAEQAITNLGSLALFSNIEVAPRPRLDEKNEGGIIVEIKLKELE